MRCSLPTAVRWAGPRRPPSGSRRRARGARSTSSWPAWAARRSLAARRRRGRRSASGGTDPADTIPYAELTFRLPARATAASAATAGLDLRLPLADHRIAQLVASVPAALRGGAAERQLLLRGALAGLLPPATLRAVHA